MIPYILHVTVITTICFLFYKLLLQKETFYRLNRWTLMGCLAVSFSLPLLPVPQEWSWRDKWAVSSGMENRETREEKSVRPVAPPAVVIEPGVPAAGVEDPGVVRAGALKAGDRTSVAGARVQKGAVAANRKASVLVTGNNQADGAGAAHRAGSKQLPGQRGATETRARNQGSSESRTSETLLLPLPMVTSAAAVAPKEDAAGNGMKSLSGTVKPTTGTPVGKDKAGTPAAIFSGAMLLLVVQWVFYFYLFGVVLFGANFLVQLGVLLYQSYARPVIQDGRFRIVEVSGNRAPCSFGNTIFINPEIYDWETYNQILIHEKIHVSGRHTLDILLAEIAVVVQWFNPFAWLYRREVENNLEFLTDADVLLHQEVERSAYQLSLLRVCAPHLPFSITNNYNQSLLKRRIVMMNSKRSSLHTVWKYFFLIPILTGLVCTLNKPVLALGAGTTGSTTAHDRNTGSAMPVNPLKLPLLFVAIADTARHPAPPKKDSADDGYSNGTGRSEGSDDPDDDDFANRAYAQAAAANYDAAQQSYNLALSVQAPLTISLQQSKANVDVKTAIQNQAMVMQIDQNNMNAQTITIQPRVQAVTTQAVTMAQDYAFNVNVNVGNLHISDTDLTDGSWFATTSGDHLSFELKVETDEHSWSNTLHVDKNEINPFPGQGNVEFKLVREAGTITFKGQFDGQEGFGHFHFTPDPAYYAALRQMGVEDMEDRRQYSFFNVNVKKDYVTMVMHNGYPHISQRDLISFAAMHIDQEFIQYWRGAGLTDADEPRNLISLKALKIDRAYVDDLKAAGYDHLEMRELQSLKAQHIDRAYIRSLGRDKDPIPVRELVSYKALHIDSAYIDGLRKAGYDNLSARDITSLYSMHVSPEYIKQLQDLGYKDLSVRDLSNLKAMKITPEYIKGFRDIGYKDLDVRALNNFSAMKITPEYIKSFQAIGYKDLEARQLDNLKAMGITPEFVKGFADLGYTDLSTNKLASLKAMNITSDFVKEFNKIGFDHIDVNVLTSLKATGVNAEYVSKMKERGFVSKDLNKYIRLKNDFN